jgi:hypothetical protein
VGSVIRIPIRYHIIETCTIPNLYYEDLTPVDTIKRVVGQFVLTISKFAFPATPPHICLWDKLLCQRLAASMAAGCRDAPAAIRNQPCGTTAYAAKNPGPLSGLIGCLNISSHNQQSISCWSIEVRNRYAMHGRYVWLIVAHYSVNRSTFSLDEGSAFSPLETHSHRDVVDYRCSQGPHQPLTDAHQDMSATSRFSVTAVRFAEWHLTGSTTKACHGKLFSPALTSICGICNTSFAEMFQLPVNCCLLNRWHLWDWPICSSNSNKKWMLLVWLGILGRKLCKCCRLPYFRIRMDLHNMSLNFRIWRSSTSVTEEDNAPRRKSLPLTAWCFCINNGSPQRTYLRV